MPAYKKSDLDALAMSVLLGQWVTDKVLDEASRKSLAEKFPAPFFMPNVFARIGLFIFGVICAAAAHGMFFLMVNPLSHGGVETPIGIATMLYGAALIALLETLIRMEKPFFRAGLEEAALYYALGSLAGGFLILVSRSHWPHYVLALLGAALLAFAAIRYVDGLLSVLASASAFYALFVICEESGELARSMLPFIVIALSAAGAWAAEAASRKQSLRFWAHLWQAQRLFYLLSCYLGGNYFVVRELSRKLLGFYLESGEDIPFAMVFYAFTAIVPFVYVGLGLARHDRLCLRAGLAAFAMAVFTYKYYHRILPLEIGLTLAGIFLIALAAATLRYFRKPKHGISVDSFAEMRRNGLLNAESIALLAAFGGKEHHAAPDAAPGIHGGGGKFGGGGAGGAF